MLAPKAISFTERVVHIIDTYALPLPSEVLQSIRQQARDSNPGGGERLAEEEAAVFLARHLHAAVMAELHSGVESRDMNGTLDAWSKFVQQAMYRADIGLINLVLYTYEILPLIDDVERFLGAEIAKGDVAKAQPLPRAPGLPL